MGSPHPRWGLEKGPINPFLWGKFLLAPTLAHIVLARLESRAVALRVEMERYGGPEVLRAIDRDPPVPSEGEVLVRVTVAGVNRADCFIRSGEWTQAGGWPYVPGLEACGTVAAVGPGVGDLAVGDAVITMMQRLGGIHGARPGGYQELLLCPAHTLARVPPSLDLDTAGALGLPAVTALLALRVLDAAPGQRVLVHAATSAVGTCAVQLLVAAGCHVIASGTRAGKLEKLRALGASELVVTSDAAWAERLSPVDRVFDLVGRATFGPSCDRSRSPATRPRRSTARSSPARWPRSPLRLRAARFAWPSSRASRSRRQRARTSSSSQAS